MRLSSDALIALEFPASLLPHPRKILWLTSADWLPDGANAVPGTSSPDRLLREACSHSFRALAAEAEHIFTISAATSYELRRHAALSAPPLYPPPPDADTFQCEQEEGYLFVPAVDGCADRVELILEALALAGEPVRARIAVNPARQEKCRQTATFLGVSERVEWLGDVDAEQLSESYARCRGVVAAARCDAFPWVPLSAMLASKPIVTCADAGAAAELVQHRKTGLVTNAAPADLSAAMDALWSHPERSRLWGRAGRDELEAMSVNWSTIVNRLLG
jgi:glycosyltransferase involved in cell wall biosynthesis